MRSLQPDRICRPGGRTVIERSSLLERMPVAAPMISPARYDAVIFDLDGVVTDTASVHRAAWRRLFDDYLASRPSRAGENHLPFTDEDYRRYVDRRSRYDGVRASSPLAGSPRTQRWCEPSVIARTSTSWSP
jgi:hypothetical protein